MRIKCGADLKSICHRSFFFGATIDEKTFGIEMIRFDRSDGISTYSIADFMSEEEKRLNGTKSTTPNNDEMLMDDGKVKIGN